MRIVAYGNNGESALGVIDGENVIPLHDLDPSLPRDLKAILERPDGLEQVQRAVSNGSSAGRLALDEVDYDLPLSHPGKIICLGLNYSDHAAEGPYDLPDYPTLFLRADTSLTPHGGPIVRPLCSEQLDYEAELVAVIGKPGRHISKADALDHVAGYSCFNDGSVRDYQRRTIQWTMGKNFDATGGFGPCFVTADEVPPGAAGLRIQSRLNGRILQDSNTAKMVFDVATTIEIVSEAITLEPGDLLVMGTPEGVGHARRPPLWMKAGDVCEIEIEAIGILSNPIVDEASQA
jgi:2-keto-4-pentenoate hydratase/2-oxohepta-3-ene-1,7-dioic acid hydratase in catechol pathway